MAANILKELQWRGLAEQISEPELEKILAEEKLTVYAGFDPSSSSLQIGNLVGILALMRFQQAGHQPIALVGGATGMIGDPSGKDAERNLLGPEAVKANIAKIRGQLEYFLGSSGADTKVIIVDNAEWLGDFGLIEFLRDVGKNFRLGYMLGKESVRRRIGEGEEGMSYTEFSYMLLQGYDFAHLFSEYGCTLQVGGSDQWGNITAGIDLTRKLHGKRVFGLTWPMVTMAGGAKFGKAEAGAIWLDCQMTSPYDFYQFWVRTDDRDVITYLKYFTMLGQDQIQKLAEQTAKEPEKRRAQQVLAGEVTRMVHGQKALEQAVQASQKLYGGALEELPPKGIPQTILTRTQLEEGLELIDILVKTGLAQSRGVAKRLIKQGGAYINHKAAQSLERRLGVGDLAKGQFIVLRAGKKNYHVLYFVE